MTVKIKRRKNLILNHKLINVLQCEILLPKNICTMCLLWEHNLLKLLRRVLIKKITGYVTTFYLFNYKITI